MKIRMSILVALMLAVCCINTTGCVSLTQSYSTEAKPIYPEVGRAPAKRYPVIDTLQPDLHWTDVKSEGRTYDVCIWVAKSHDDNSGSLGVPGVQKSWGDQVYYAEGIKENHHKINIQLKSNTCYHWSVRIHNGSNVSDWSSFNESKMVANLFAHDKNVPYGFITPDK